MKKKLMALALVSAMVLGLTACGGGSSSAPASDAGTGEAAAPAATASSEGDIRLVNGKIEVDAALKAAAEAYKAETGVTVAIESMGGGVNIQDTLKGYYQADNMPDIFVCGSDADFGNWTGLLADLSNEPWAADTDAGYKDADGKLIGFPYTTEAIGLAYNADILEKAGIDPASITGPESMKAAFETLDAKKDELGLTAVIGWCCEAKDLYWSTGSHSFANYLDAGLSRDDTTYSDMLADGGKIDAERFQHYAEMVALFNQYSDPALLTSGTYDQQILGFASGKYAFVTQGSWIGATMTSDDAAQYEEAGNFKVGMIPYAFEEGIDTILTNSPSWWAVFENDNTQKAKDFLTWLAGDEGQKFLVEDAGFISPFKSCKYVASDPFAQTISDYTAAGKTSSWHWLKNKASLDQNVLGQLYLDYALGNIPDAATFTQVVSDQVANYYAQ
ncbi:MAG: ABC transporter substrate-binding protein [Lachnospiraceae bacterium]|nr:ABC transporter substrate-binding protein [Lachnospiraceae bacterium]